MMEDVTADVGSEVLSEEGAAVEETDESGEGWEEEDGEEGEEGEEIEAGSPPQPPRTSVAARNNADAAPRLVCVSWNSDSFLLNLIYIYIILFFFMFGNMSYKTENILATIRYVCEKYFAEKRESVGFDRKRGCG